MRAAAFALLAAGVSSASLSSSSKLESHDTEQQILERGQPEQVISQKTVLDAIGDDDKVTGCQQAQQILLQNGLAELGQEIGWSNKRSSTSPFAKQHQIGNADACNTYPIVCFFSFFLLCSICYHEDCRLKSSSE